MNDKVYPGIDKAFSDQALKLFRHQAINNPVYNQFLKLLDAHMDNISSILEIPFLPISLFKTHAIKTGSWQEKKIFLSSGTTGQVRSKHYIKDVSKYLKNTQYGFTKFYGNIEDWTILAYLPGYSENTSSSLIEMMAYFIDITRQNGSKFIPFNQADLLNCLLNCKLHNKKTLLIGVSHALIDFVEKYQISFPELILMETGGMKGLKEELTKMDLHTLLKTGFGLSHVHSEYGMTELLSQAYSKGEGIYECSDTLRILIKDPTDPLEVLTANRNGVINIIDLANEDSCAFIATEDLGRVAIDGSFELLGRLDVADLRGCNLLFYS
ncbi:MAG TPA: hypothetical protein VK590_14750 [Saprospiraceae bacterium]|nr:hypothetical protein [Saprospiraceae bacterium]